jgi:hypothetical protein
MKRKLLNPLALIICSFLFVIAIAADLNGKWVGVISIPGGGQDLDVAYNFKVDGEKLTGTASSPTGDVPIENGKISGDKFSFSVNVNNTDYPHTGKIYADSCAVDIDFGGAKSHFIIKRAK